MLGKKLSKLPDLFLKILRYRYALNMYPRVEAIAKPIIPKAKRKTKQIKKLKHQVMKEVFMKSLLSS